MSSPLATAIDGLTREQRHAVEHPGDFSLMARPGSGKTRVVGLRLARAAATQGKRVALASYTNVAVGEAHAVIAAGGVVLGPGHYIGTLHGLLLDYLVRPLGHLVLDKPGGSLRIRDDDWGLTGGGGWPKVALDGAGKIRIPISYFDWTPSGEVICRRRPPNFHYATPEQITELGGAEARRLKIEQLKRRQVITQSDAMFVALRLLARPRLAAALAGRFDELVVDEAQDSSDVQIACVHALRATSRLRSLVVVADLEQSIYGFQGADPAGCQHLIDSCGLAPLSLTHNFRSSQRICDVARHFTARETADIATGPHAACPIGPELLRFPAPDPGAAVTTFTSRLEIHGLSAGDAVVLSRGRHLRDKINGQPELRCNRVVKALGRLAEVRTSGRTLTAAAVTAAEDALLWCIADTRHLQHLPPDARRRLRVAVGRLARELPATTGTLADWITAARPVLQQLLTDTVDPRHTLSHKPHEVLRALKPFNSLDAGPALGGRRSGLHAQTVHAVKGCSVDAVLMVVEPASTRGDPAQTLIDLGAGAGDLSDRELLRIGFVALTRARRYCAIALADTVPTHIHDKYTAMGFTPA